ncbi:hypothetical protein G6F35_017918 [Rhizopus arrhizus]|nr:hypothetical protein G6F35_017918 [Rhizopus arrhizus]
MLRGWTSPQVVRRADDQPAQRRPHRHCHHVLGDELMQAHAGVVAFGNDIDQAIVLGQLHPHVRMRVQEARKPRPQLGRHRRAGGVDAQQAGRGGAELVHLFQRVMHLAQGRL